MSFQYRLQEKEPNLSTKQAVARPNEDKVYSRAFKKIYTSQVTEKFLGDALLAYQKTLENRQYSL